VTQHPRGAMIRPGGNPSPNPKHLGTAGPKQRPERTKTGPETAEPSVEPLPERPARGRTTVSRSQNRRKDNGPLFGVSSGFCLKDIEKIGTFSPETPLETGP